MSAQTNDIPLPPKELVGLVDTLFAAAPRAIVLGDDFKYRTDRGAPSKTELYRVFFGDFKGKLASWRNATEVKGSPRNQYYRTEELIAIFSNDVGKLDDGRKPVVNPSRLADYDEFYVYLKKEFPEELNDAIVGLGVYRSQLIKAFANGSGHRVRVPIVGIELGADGSTDRAHEPSREFGASVLMYTRYLKSTRRHQMVIELRNKLTHLFHLLGLNAQREAMGRLALESSTVLKDSASKAETLIDDLGWAVHLQDRTEEAEQNIQSAVSMLEIAEPRSLEEKVRMLRARSKGHRHLAFLAKDPSRREFHLEESGKAIAESKSDEKAMEMYRTGLLCDQAQLLHAKAYLSARDLNVHQEGVIPGDDSNARKIAEVAMRMAQEAVKVFEEIGDLERQVKALVLVERLYLSLEKRIEAMETSALREEVLSMSGIDGGMTTIALQKPTSV